METTFEWKFKPIRFNGLAVPQLIGEPAVFKFPSKEYFETWYKGLVANLAELDEAMNYCHYFEREEGNKGHYVRDGKSFPVDGSWVGIQDFDNYPPTKSFVAWLEENGWRKDWFKLKDKYIEHQNQSLYHHPIR